MRLLDYDGPHVKVLRTTLFSPATLASTLGDLAAVYARFARFPGGVPMSMGWVPDGQ